MKRVNFEDKEAHQESVQVETAKNDNEISPFQTLLQQYQKMPCVCVCEILQKFEREVVGREVSPSPAKSLGIKTTMK